MVEKCLNSPTTEYASTNCFLFNSRVVLCLDPCMLLSRATNLLLVWTKFKSNIFWTVAQSKLPATPLRINLNHVTVSNSYFYSSFDYILFMCYIVSYVFHFVGLSTFQRRKNNRKIARESFLFFFAEACEK